MQQNGVRRPSTADDARDRFSDGRRRRIFADDALREAQVREEAARGGSSLVVRGEELWIELEGETESVGTEVCVFVHVFVYIWMS